MGITRSTIMGLRLLVLVALAAYKCDALPSATDLVVPEGMMMQVAFSTMTPTAFISAMTKNGGTEAQCSTFASTTVDTITKAVSSQQGILNALRRGNACADQGQDEVTEMKANVVTAEADLVAKQGAVATALSAKDTDCAATVDFSVNLDTLQVNECFDYKTQDSYIQKKNVCDSKTTAWKTANDAIAPAETKVTDAKSAAVDAETAASGLKVKCQCAAKKSQADAWTAVQEGHASHAADWKQANEILCTLNAQSTACNNLPCPAVTKPALAAGVADADCTEATTATPAATPTTASCSGSNAARCHRRRASR